MVKLNKKKISAITLLLFLSIIFNFGSYVDSAIAGGNLIDTPCYMFTDQDSNIEVWLEHKG